MFVVLAVVFLVVPIVEIYVMLQVAGAIGVPETILLLIAISFVGRLARQDGRPRRARPPAAHGAGREGAVGRARRRRPSCCSPAALMITPGFMSDCLAILLLLPPSRAVVRGRRAPPHPRSGWPAFQVITTAPARGGRPGAAGDVWDVESWEDPDLTLRSVRASDR